MATLGISKDFWRHTRAFQDILAEGREEGRRREASTLALRQLERRCGSLDAPTTVRIEALSLWQLEELALALLDFSSAQDLQTWLEQLET
jgi:predicted transposase YdaD